MRPYLFALGLGVLAAACGSPSEDAAESDDALEGSVSNARACAVKKAYGAATIDAFEPISKSELPTTISTTNPLSLSTLRAPGIDLVYVVEEATGTTFYDRRGFLLARASNGTPMAWSAPSGSALACDGEAPPAPPVQVKKLVGGSDVVLLGIAGNDAIYRALPASVGGDSTMYAIPLAGGTPVKLFTIGARDNTSFSNGVIGHWSGVANGVGDLEVWSRATGLVPNVATQSVVGFLRASAKGTRIAFSQAATIAGTRPASTAFAVRDLAAPTNALTFDGPYRVNLAAPASCGAQIAFAGETLFMQHCLGESTTETRARLVAVKENSTSPLRLDAPTLDAANTLDGKVRFSVDANGQKVAAARMGGSGVVYRLATSDAIPLVTATSYTMLSNGEGVLYRNAANDLFMQSTTNGLETKLASGVLALTGLSRDGRSIAFATKPRDPATSYQDVNVVRPFDANPEPRLLTEKGLALGFSGDSSLALYLDGASGVPQAMSASVTGDSARVLMKQAAGGRAATTGTGFVVFNDVKNATATTPSVGQINYIDAKSGGQLVTLATDVPIAATDNELFVSGNRVAFTDLASGKEGIYTVTLP